MLKGSWVQALCAAVFVLALAGCGGDECESPADCRAEKGNPPAGKEYTCVENTCGLKDSTPTEKTCEPECANGEFCDTTGATGVCRVCSGAQGCAAPLVCDAAANSGKGQCKTCRDSSPTSRDEGCTSATPVCNATGGNGLGVCLACVDTASGGAADLGCSTSTPMCDPAANNGVGICKACVDDMTGGSTDTGCFAASPFCDPAAANGVGACKTCADTATGTGTDQGCAAAAPVCNILANGGRGVCKVCADSATGNDTDLGCPASAPLCDGGTGTSVGLCKACVDSATGNGVDQGCGASNPVCDAAANSGVGVCKVCTDTATGTGTDVGCGAAAPLCDPAASGGAGLCKACTDTATGTGTDLGCGASAPLCNTASAGGVGACKACLDTATPGNGEDLGCFNPTAICDVAASNGVGSCKVCVSTEGCPGAQTCNAQGTACEGCTDNTSCTNPSTPICKPPPPVSVCVECTDNTHCASAIEPACNPATNFCGCGDDAACAATGGTTDFCDLAANNNRGVCKFCVTDQNCAQVIDPTKPFCRNQTECIQCRTTADCSLNSVCNASSACEVVPGADPAATSAQIAAFLAAPEGPLTPARPIENAFITYIKPALGTDLAGFFLQAEANGPAMFVEGATTGLQVGDRVTLSVTEKAVKTGVDTAISLAAAPTIVSRGHPVQNLNTATPAGLAVDHSGKALTEFTTEANLNAYESELVSFTGTIASASASVGAGHVGFQIITPGMGNTPAPTNNFRLRMDAAIATQLDIAQGCQFTLKAGPMWRFTPSATSNAAQPSVYNASDLVMNCPAPKLLQARALSPTTVLLSFDRTLNDATVQAADFTIATLTVNSAAASGKQVTLTTSSQAAGQAYTVSVDGEVRDVGGKTVDPAAKSTNFTGFSPPPTGPSLVINEIDADNNGTDTSEFIEIHNRGGQAADLSNVILLLVNGDATGTGARREYLRFPLSAVTDAGGNPATSLPAGGYIVAGSSAYLSVTPLPASALRLTIAATGTTPGANIVQNGADGIGLLDDTAGTLIDAVYYKGGDTDEGTNGPIFTIATSGGDKQLNFREGTIVLSRELAVGSDSIGRAPNGADTNDNNYDFIYSATGSPGAANP
jgi:hypothetical protein